MIDYIATNAPMLNEVTLFIIVFVSSLATIVSVVTRGLMAMIVRRRDALTASYGGRAERLRARLAWIRAARGGKE